MGENEDFWIKHLLSSYEAVESFVGFLKSREDRALREVGELVTKNLNEAIALGGEYRAFKEVRTRLESYQREEQDYADYKERTGQE